MRLGAESHIPAKIKLEYALQRYEDHIRSAGDNPTTEQTRHLERERMHVEAFADLTHKLEEYYGIVDSPQYDIYQDEHQSQRLGENMRAVGRPKPTERYDAHAIVSGSHDRAALSRVKMARLRVGLDDPDNGAWLPRRGHDAKGSRCWATPGAIPHSRIHRKSYYNWITRQVSPVTNRDVLKQRLRTTGARLESGDIPANIKEELRYDDLQSS
ncbi:AHH domain-containing protein [Sansalvadorimonas sp. 2012CJ34-2]|uniref:AHH domain-containing protein n=1 Tax=Parendozoicomonas callyspongiae TaxID=2942213 RepID=A0ABT0PDK9_9GAMM|nr:AHH domain-containing protein [Sansalvadorimonas sp. 2012CJ34-2]MCL6269346.1 AHH domain-containing protein [Sansalvadorimonas sp. 2012CJ34-2]